MKKKSRRAEPEKGHFWDKRKCIKCMFSTRYVKSNVPISGFASVVTHVVPLWRTKGNEKKENEKMAERLFLFFFL
jgi:hypothetical protein